MKYIDIEERDLYPYQKKIFHAILEEKKDVMAVIRTGGGKSLCYQYPASKLPGLTLVIEPLNALMNDQVYTSKLFAHPELNARMVKRLPDRKNLDVLQECIDSAPAVGESKLPPEKRVKILYISPELLVRPHFLHFARQVNLSMIVVDEAHCMSLWGYSFRKSYLSVCDFLKRLGTRPILVAFTATATPYIEKDIMSLLGMKKPFRISPDHQAGGFSVIRPEIKLSVCSFKTGAGKFRALYHFLKKHQEESGMIYCSMVDQVTDIYERLKKQGYPVAYYHGRMDQEEREKNHNAFDSGESKIMVATQAYGMGINKKDVRYVIHFSIPGCIEDYYQQTGRAARDHKPAEAVLYYTGEDAETMDRSIRCEQPVEGFGSKLEAEFLKEMNRIRFSRMKDLVQVGLSQDKPKVCDRMIKEYIQDYFSANHQPDMDGHLELMRKNILAELRQSEFLYMNTTKISSMLRNGKYEVRQCNVVSLNQNESVQVAFAIDGKLDYFDMMVADAVYTLNFLNRSVIYLTDILKFISGNEKATLLPELKEAMLKSLDKMSGIHIRIDRKSARHTRSLNQEKNNAIIEGRFLSLKENPGKTGFVLEEVPPLYRFAEINNGEFMAVPLKYLKVRTGEKMMRNSVENMMLKYNIVYHIMMTRPHGGNKALSRRIRLFSNRKDRKGMYETLGILDQSRMNDNRRVRGLDCKVLDIFSYEQEAGLIVSYGAAYWETEEQKMSRICGVEWSFIRNWDESEEGIILDENVQGHS